MRGYKSKAKNPSAEPEKVKGFTWMEWLLVAISFFAIFWLAYGFFHWFDGSFGRG